MKTKLETMVGYLAGRQGDAVERIRLELEDPGSDASQWLVEMRSRSRALFRPGTLEQPLGGRSTTIPAATARSRPSRGWWLRPLVLGTSAAALVLLAAPLAWRARDDRSHHLESLLAQQDSRWGTRLERIEAAVAALPAPPPAETQNAKNTTSQVDKSAPQTEATTALALARLEARLGELGDRLGQEETKQETPALSVEPLRGDLERLRREIELNSQASKKQIQELSAVLREVLHLLKRLAVNARSQDPAQIPVPVPMPQGHVPGLGQRPETLGSASGQPADPLLMRGQAPQHQQWGLQNHTGGHFGAGMQTPGGPG